MIPDLVEYVYGMKESYLKTVGELAAKINTHNTTRPWESGRVLDFVHSFLRRKRDVDHDTNPELLEWIDAFEDDRADAGLRFWEALRQGMESAIQPK
jgi:glyceraldehyde-3-phosphate dehydrogenase (ferredoxin)